MASGDTAPDHSDNLHISNPESFCHCFSSNFHFRFDKELSGKKCSIKRDMGGGTRVNSLRESSGLVARFYFSSHKALVLNIRN